MASVAVIDYGMGNLRSVAKALEHVGASPVYVTYDPEVIVHAERVVFPGVGALGDCMSELHRLELETAVVECARSKPFLGICLGMQALMEVSEENEGTRGLGVIPGRVIRFRSAATEAGERIKIPHMGWNQVHQRNRDHPLWADIPQDARFYFVHSYYVQPASDEAVAGQTRYGVEFVSAIARGNVFATQFHPEKSQHAGLTLLANFLQWEGGA